MPPKQQKAAGSSGAQFLNLERVPNLAPKFANKIGKTCTGFSVRYEIQGVSVIVQSRLGERGQLLADMGVETVILHEFERRVTLHNAPTDEERLSSLARKYELRLNRAFPAQGPANGTEAGIQAWLGTLSFAERRALLMSQKDFQKSYPDGFRA